MTLKKKHPVAPPSSEAAFKAARVHLDMLAPATIIQPNVDVQVAAVAALGVARGIDEPAIRSRFKALGKTGEYDARCIDDLAIAAQAAWYARHMAVRADAVRSDAQVPAAITEEATALRATMAKATEYNLGDDPRETDELAFLRGGHGYQDLANDLLAYAAMYERNKKALALDQKHYRARDIARAQELGGQIIAALGESATAEQREWSDLQARAWTWLLRVYGEVQRGGRFLFAYDDAEAKFPSLVAVARAGRTSKPAKDEGLAEEASPEAAAAAGAV